MYEDRHQVLQERVVLGRVYDLDVVSYLDHDLETVLGIYIIDRSIDHVSV